MTMYRFVASLLAAFVFSILAACGGGEGDVVDTEIKLVSIQITPAALSKAVGLTQAYSAIGTFSSGPNRDITSQVTWASSDAAKVSVTSAGLATAKAIGAPTITAAIGSIKSNVATFNVTSAELVSIQITPALVSKAAGLAQQYTALGTYTDASTPDITANVKWASTNTATVAITSAGLATGQSLGSSVITASLGAVTSNNGSYAVTAATLVAIQITPATVSKAAGLSQQYIALGTYTDASTPDITANVKWASSNTAAVAINSAGLATGQSLGSSVITASLGAVTSNNGSYAVIAPTLVAIQITPATASKAAGLVQQYTATGLYTDRSTTDLSTSVSWNSSDTSKATINSSGLGTAVAVGAVNITASLNGISSNNATLSVTAATLVSVQITPATASKAAGLQQQYTAIGTYTDGRNSDISASMSWNSSDTGKATISSSGLATTLAVGTTNITASLNGITSSNATLNVTAAALVSIAITPATASKAAGLQQQYTAIGTYTDGSKPDISASVSWNSSDTSKATISSSGLATTVAVGTTNITASLNGITSNNATLNVTAALLVSVQVTPAPASKAVGLTQQYIAIGTYTDGSKPDISASVSWNSGDTGKATISTGGLATAVAVGASGITAMKDQITSNTATLTVTAAELVSIEITPAIASKAVGQTQQYIATGTYTDGRKPDISSSVNWNSSDTAKATISNTGLATAVALGASNISASLNGVASNIAVLNINPWAATGAISAKRYFHTATRLLDGKVLVTGGTDDTSYFASSDLYDPATGVWTATGQMGAGRTYHTATLLPSGKVLVTGGFNTSQGVLASSELYDPTTGVWTATGSMGGSRYFHTATLLPGTGKVLVTGGIDGAGLTASSALYDLVTGLWTATGPMGTARTGHTATLLPVSGKVLVTGGQNSVGGALASSELYDPVAGVWTARISPMGTARTGHTATLLPSGKVLVTGGQNSVGIFTGSELYDPAAGVWTATGAMGTARADFTATLLASGKVLVAGGNGNTGTLGSSELYDPATGTFTGAGPMGTERAYYTATLLADGKVLVTGGANDLDYIATSELYTP